MMSALYRGLSLQQRCSHPSPLRNSSLLYNVCTTSSSIIFRGNRSLSSKRIKPPATTPLRKGGKLTPQSTTTPAPTAYSNYASVLASKSGPSLLYQAPSHTLFIIASYTGATFCLLYAGWNFQESCLHPPPNLSTWIPYAFGGICFMMSALGGWLLLGTSRLVRRMVAHPNAKFPGGLELQVELRKMLPLPEFVYPARIISCVPDEMGLNHRLHISAVHAQQRQSPAERIRARREKEEARKRADEIERSKIMTAPFRHANMAFHSMFKNIARTWSREGFLKLDIKGQYYKLDVSSGWALDEGRAIDRLIKVKRKL